MCMSTEVKTPIVFDVYIVEDFYTDEDIFIPGNLYIGKNASFYAENVEVGGDIIILCTEEEAPSVDALSLKAHGIIETNCIGSIVASNISALGGCFCTDNY